MNILLRHIIVFKKFMFFFVVAGAVSVVIPLIFHLISFPDIELQMLSSVYVIFTTPVMLQWFWLGALPVLAVALWWGQIRGSFAILEVLRYESYRKWITGVIVFVFFVVIIFVLLGPFASLLYVHHMQLGLVLQIAYLLLMYLLALCTTLIALTAWRLSVSSALLVIIVFHAINVLFCGIGFPNILTFFLMSERASLISILLANCYVFGLTALLVALAGPKLMSDGGDESL